MSLRSFVIWRPENGQDEDDGKGVCAYNAEEAVERWARWDDANSADYHIVGGQPAKVMARDLSTGTATEWIVSGESVPHYSARKIAAGGAHG